MPAGVLLLALAGRSLPAAERRGERLDVRGVVLLSTAMLALVIPLVLGQDAGWPAWTWACLAGSGVRFAGLWTAERRLAARGGAPLVDPRLLSRPAIAWGLASMPPQP